MDYNQALIFAILILLASSCASTRELPPMPDYNSRGDYIDLVKDDETVEWSFFDNPAEASNMIEFGRVIGLYYDKLNCESTGEIQVSFVITKKARIDAPSIEKSLSESCDRSILMSLQFLKFDDPAYVDGNPVNFITRLNFTTNR